MYAPTTASADDVWAVVGDPWQFAAWTGGDHVDTVAPEPVVAGTEIVVVEDASVRTWHVTSIQERLKQMELVTDLDEGQLRMGYRVVPQERGSRLVVAAALDPARKVGAMRARLVELPALRRRLDHYTALAVRAAEARV